MIDLTYIGIGSICFFFYYFQRCIPQNFGDLIFVWLQRIIIVEHSVLPPPSFPNISETSSGLYGGLKVKIGNRTGTKFFLLV